MRNGWSCFQSCLVPLFADASSEDLTAEWQDLPEDHQQCLAEALERLEPSEEAVADRTLTDAAGVAASPVENLDAETLNQRGWEHLCSRRYQEAIEHFSRAIELDSTFAEAYNNRGIAKKIVEEDAAEDEAKADSLTMHDVAEQMKLRQQRKWMCVGFDARGEPEGETVAANVDFLISFASPDSRKNNQILEELKSGVYYCGEVRPVTFCTDKSLGMGMHIKEVEKSKRWNPIFSDLDQPRQPGEYPAWFRHYKKAADETRHGLLILQLTEAYLKFSALRGG